MKFKIKLTIISILLYLIGFSQDQYETKLDSITTEAQASEFIERHKSAQGKLIVFNKEKHNTRLANDLFELGKGGKKVYESELNKTYYKLIDTENVLHYRVSYIFLDGNKKPLQDISIVRNDIISKYKKGISFKDLAKRYSMDINNKRGGDSGWFSSGEMMPEFENEIISDQHTIGDIFTIDVTSRNSYYVVLKTYDKKMIEEIKVLKIVEPISR